MTRKCIKIGLKTPRAYPANTWNIFRFMHGEKINRTNIDEGSFVI